VFRSCLLCCFLLITNGLTPTSPPQSDRLHDQWLQERYFEATSIKEGMTRSDLLKVFRMDGGLQPFLATRYVLKASNFIKVDVEFDVPIDAKGKILPEDLRHEMENSSAKENYRFVTNEKLIIKSISRPYLEQFAYD
jgi:hypothetical protein